MIALLRSIYDVINKEFENRYLSIPPHCNYYLLYYLWKGRKFQEITYIY